MQFLIADTFTDSLAKLTNEEQKAVKTTVFDLQVDPANPGIQLHRIERVKDKGFWSARVSRNIRLILYRSNFSMLVCYVGHHDNAYKWASNRKLEQHPKTGAAQMVVINERIKEISIPVYKIDDKAEAETQKNLLFYKISTEELLEYGVPEEWLTQVKAATEDNILDIAAELPAEAAEAVLKLAIGEKPEKPVIAAQGENPFEHPDALRRFRVMDNREELEQALQYPWEKWSIFLHPAQKEIVTQTYSGPARVSGSAGTGKTIVALHRAVHLARKHENTRVLVTTFSETLANVLKRKIRALLEHQPRLGERIEVTTLDSYAERLYRLQFGKPIFASRSYLIEKLQEFASKETDKTFSSDFFIAEWERVIDAWNIQSWDEYKNVQRSGRRTRLPEEHRKELWKVFEALRSYLNGNGLVTLNQVYHKLYEYFASSPIPFEFILVDESQDISVAQLRFLSRLADQPDALFFAGDTGQRIFQQPFSWASLGVEIRGRSKMLKINYRTSHQIRSKADKLLGTVLNDPDGNEEDRSATISVFNGPSPSVKLFDSEENEKEFISDWLTDLLSKNIVQNEIALFVRSETEIARAEKAATNAGLDYTLLDQNMKVIPGTIVIGTMHLAKGMEFRAVAVMACDEEILPSEIRIEETDDLAELEHVYEMERHLLYVACTRARDQLIITGIEPGSEFLVDIA